MWYQFDPDSLVTNILSLVAVHHFDRYHCLVLCKYDRYLASRNNIRGSDFNLRCVWRFAIQMYALRLNLKDKEL